MITKWDYEGEFLNQFLPNMRGTVANWFCYAVRGAKGFLKADTPEGICVSVHREIERKLRWNDIYSEDQEATYLKGINAVQTNEAVRFAAFILERENLSPEERNKLRDGLGAEHAKERMSQEPPTQKQLDYLQALKCSIVPVSKLEASDLIGQYVKKKAA